VPPHEATRLITSARAEATWAERRVISPVEITERSNGETALLALPGVVFSVRPWGARAAVLISPAVALPEPEEEVPADPREPEDPPQPATSRSSRRGTVSSARCCGLVDDLMRL
jgi:hypothetical protein